MTHTLARLYYHCIFSTKLRRTTITNDIRSRVYGYIRGVVVEHNATLKAIGGTADHIHLLLELPASLAVADMMRLIKTNSSKWIRESFPAHADFRWQRGYAAFTVSMSRRNDTISYIETQETHHKTRTFEDEYGEFLKRHGYENPVDASV